MTTSQPMSLTSVISRSDEAISSAQLGYLEAMAQDEAHDLVRKLFMDLSETDAGITRAFLARRLSKGPEQITRWLAVPGNWTLSTLADLLAAMGYSPTFGARLLSDDSTANYVHPLVERMAYHDQRSSRTHSLAPKQNKAKSSGSTVQVKLLEEISL